MIGFGDTVAASDPARKLIIQFTAPWCGPCRALAPRLGNIVNNYDNIEYYKVDVDENPDIVQELMITSVPTVVCYNGGEIIDRCVGLQSDAYYKSVLEKL